MKKVLVITYHYPPINNGATPRLSQFVKYLPQYGYIPTVLTTNKFGMTDDDKNILRVREYGVIEKSRILLITYKIIRKILYRTGLVVDPLIIWRLQCIRFIDKLLLHEKFDLVFASFPPSVNIELAIYLKKKYNLPLVSDFRDGLVFEPLRKENVFRRLSDKYFEKKVVKNSDYIITVTPPITKYFHLKYENCKVDTITNGFQEYDYQENILLNTDNVNILYSGRISLSSASQTINLFIDVLSGLISTNVFAKKIKFIVIGDLTKQEIDYLNKKLNSNFEYRGLVEHHQSILFQKQANYLLFVASESRSSLATTKIYEYISSGTPIIALTKGTYAEEIIKSTKTGICIGNNEYEKMKLVLSSTLEQMSYIDWFKPEWNIINRYNRKILTKKLANIFDKVVGDKE